MHLFPVLLLVGLAAPLMTPAARDTWNWIKGERKWAKIRKWVKSA